MHREEISCHLLKILSQEHNLTQRDMARKVGISLGKINYCLSELVRKGFVKVHRFRDAQNKRAYGYILTPRGIQEKARITITGAGRSCSVN